ncbi:hypothetical protein SJI19_21230 [Acerihabitans sp. TG2]|nr:hypothetical protein [Acerihabitans sp. TG2]MEA9393027.1 hypothetical protein [Acerihabitans sp. TG2]
MTGFRQRPIPRLVYKTSVGRHFGQSGEYFVWGYTRALTGFRVFLFYS